MFRRRILAFHDQSKWFEGKSWCRSAELLEKNLPPPTFFWFSTRYFAPTPIKPVLRRKRTGVALQIFCPIQNSLRSEEVMSIWKFFADFFSAQFFWSIFFERNPYENRKQNENLKKSENLEIFFFFQKKTTTNFLKDFLWKKCRTKNFFFGEQKKIGEKNFRRKIFKST